MRELGERMDSRELSEWIVFDSRIRISEADRQVAKLLLMQALCNWGGKGRRPRYEDYLPDRRPRKAAMSGDEIMGVLKGMSSRGA